MTTIPRRRDPEEVRCGHCGAPPGQPCRRNKYYGVPYSEEAAVTGPHDVRVKAAADLDTWEGR